MKKVILFLISVIFFNTVLTSGAVEQNSDSLFDVYFSFTSNGIYCENPVLEDGLGIEIYIDNKSDYEAEILIFTVFYYKSKIISSDFSKRIAEPEKMTGIEKELYFPAKEWDSVKLFILDYNSHKPLTDIVDVATLISKGTPTIITDAKQIKNSINSENDSDCFILMVKNDGYYDIKTTGTDMYAVLYGEDMLPVISTKGASTQNSWTYNLKKDIRYTIKLNSVQGAGSYILEINKLNNLITSLPTAHNIPLLSTGMTPVYWENEHIKLTEPENTAWYNYNTDENRWANVIMNDGSLYVWVPRYAYRIICDSNTNNSYSHQIETKYLKGLSNIAYDGTVCKTVSENPQDGDFIVSPGFTHGEDEYSGIWISKFQACVSDNEIPKFVPDSNILVNTKLKDILSTFIKTKNYYYLEDGADIHLLKNSEWSAAAYLAYSTCYNTAPTANRSHITGGGNYSENTNQSTTQNIYGIYDMSGAAEEFVAAYVKGSNVSEWESYDPKYYDIIDFSGDTVGQAIYETRSWCEDRNKNPSAVGIFRGYEGTTGGIEALGIFGYQTRSVSADKDKSWRAAIWIEGENPYNEIIANQTNELIYNADIILKNPYTGRMENATIIRSSDFHIDSPYVSMVNANLYWDKIMPDGSIEIVDGKINVSGVLDKDYIEGVSQNLAEHSPRLDSWRNKNVHVVFRVIMDEPSQEGCEIPHWVEEAMKKNPEYGIAVTQYTFDGGVTAFHPNYNNEILIEAHRHLIEKLAEAYNDDPFVPFVQLGSIGRWGEWNSHTEELELPNTEISDKYVYPYIKYFNKKVISMRYPHQLSKKYKLNMYDDTICSNKGLNEFLERANNLRKKGDDEKEAHPPMPYFWQKNIVYGESASNSNGKWIWFSSLIPDSRTIKDYQLEEMPYIDNSLKQIKRLHLSFLRFAFKNSDIKEGKEAIVNNIETVLKTIGPRLWVSNIEADSVLKRGCIEKVTLTWQNGGIAPFYFDWEVELSLLDNEGNPVIHNGKAVKTVTNPIISKCLPDIKFSQEIKLEIPENLDLTKDEYKLAVSINSPYTDEPAMELAMDTENYNKRYVLKNVTLN